MGAILYASTPQTVIIEHKRYLAIKKLSKGPSRCKLDKSYSWIRK